MLDIFIIIVRVCVILATFLSMTKYKDIISNKQTIIMSFVFALLLLNTYHISAHIFHSLITFTLSPFYYYKT